MRMVYGYLLLLLQETPTRGNGHSLSPCCVPGTGLIILHVIFIYPPSRNNLEEQDGMAHFASSGDTGPGVTQLVRCGATQVCLTSNLCFFGYTMRPFFRLLPPAPRQGDGGRWKISTQEKGLHEVHGAQFGVGSSGQPQQGRARRLPRRESVSALFPEKAQLPAQSRGFRTPRCPRHPSSRRSPTVLKRN